MSSRNGERARFHLSERRKRHHRQRVRAALAALTGREASAAQPEPGGPVIEPLGGRLEQPRRRPPAAKR
jgi:hypothetical protein